MNECCLGGAMAYSVRGVAVGDEDEIDHSEEALLSFY
jgi:hypothetical protein